jgi:hypothetical protein
MNEIDVTKVTAIEYLEKLIKISNEENCNYENDCNTCSHNLTSCASIVEIANMGVENHIKGVMTFELSETEIDWTKVEKDTLIEVRDFETDDWSKRYFSHYLNGQVFAYIDGRTSKTETFVSPWEYARLVEDDNE